MANIRDVELLNRAIGNLGDSFMQNRLLKERQKSNQSLADYRDDSMAYNREAMSERKRQYDTSRQDSLNASAGRESASRARSVEDYAKWVADSVRDGFIPPEALPKIREQLSPEQAEQLKGTPLWDTLQFVEPKAKETTPAKLGEMEKMLMQAKVGELESINKELNTMRGSEMDPDTEGKQYLALQDRRNQIMREFQRSASPTGAPAASGSQYPADAVSKAAKANSMAQEMKKQHPDWTTEQIRAAVMQEMQ